MAMSMLIERLQHKLLINTGYLRCSSSTGPRWTTMKTTSTASIDEKIKALHELKAEQAKRQHAKIIAVMKDRGRTADDLGRAFRNSWFHWISEPA